MNIVLRMHYPYLKKMSKQKGKIGIISHVEVLKENIPGGIEVEKTRNGSNNHNQKGLI